ncbi:hypothetical protein BJX66DRAFT_352804 [Aspergillus keveii]|uniref:GPI anchored protein n=1 Tax=Aspergillus keveii TaxID=714993 RepID=A0ABR4FYK4_9EURO
MALLKQHALLPFSLSLLATTLTLTPAQAQDLSAGIIGCADLSCPIGDTYKCHLGSTTYTNVGLSRIPDIPSALKGLSLLKAVHVANPESLDVNVDVPDNQTAYRSAYYIATPEDIDPADLSGCTVLFNDPPSKKFNGEIESAVGTCNDVIEKSCIEVLRSRVEETFSDGGQCSDLETELGDINECADFAGEGNGLGNFTVTSLADLMSLSGAQNASSDCWPVSPKSDGLAFLGEDVVVNDFSGETSANELFKITPVLTVFPRGGGVDDTSAQLTCLKAVEVIGDEGEGSDEDEDGEGDAGSFVGANMLTMVIGVLASTWFAML